MSGDTLKINFIGPRKGFIQFSPDSSGLLFNYGLHRKDDAPIEDLKGHAELPSPSGDLG